MKYELFAKRNNYAKIEILYLSLRVCFSMKSRVKFKAISRYPEAPRDSECVN